MTESKSIGEMFFDIKKRKEELETENSDLKIENGALRAENTYLIDKVSVLEAHIKNTERRNRIPNSGMIDYILQ